VPAGIDLAADLPQGSRIVGQPVGLEWDDDGDHDPLTVSLSSDGAQLSLCNVGGELRGAAGEILMEIDEGIGVEIVVC
jgi:hypothetical protein